MMKKWLIWIWVIALSVSIVIPVAAAASQIRVVVNGEKVDFPDAPPYVDRQSNRTMVPARFVSEKLGARMGWNKDSNQITFSLRNRTILLTIGQNKAQVVNGETITLDTPAVIKNNRVMIPLRLIGQLFQAEVEWDAQRKQAIVTIPPKIPKGTWIWDSRVIETDRDRILSFASEHDVNAIYLHMNRDIAPQTYADFIRSAKMRQIRVEALAGRPDWGLKSKQDQIRDFIAWVRQYNASVESEERFDGLHFDIEPYLLAEWDSNNRMILENWLHNLRFIEQEAKGSGLEIALDVPFWLHNVKVPDTEYSFSAWLLEKFDTLVIMDYRNHALGKDGIVANAQVMLKQASALGKSLIVAVETARSLEGDRVSFYSKSPDFMDQELLIAHLELSRHAGYAGMAIHDYRSWVAMVGSSE